MFCASGSLGREPLMTLIRRILWAVEGSEHERVLDYAHDLIRSVGASCVLLHAIEPVLAADGEVQGFYEDLKEKSMSRMTPLVERLRAKDISIDPVIVIAPRWQTILEHARREGCDMIILGTSEGDNDSLVLGATTYRILHGSEIPLLIVR